MLVVIIAGIVYAILTDSLVVALLTASLVIYRAHRPSKFMGRVREAWMQRQIVQERTE